MLFLWQPLKSIDLQDMLAYVRHHDFSLAPPFNFRYVRIFVYVYTYTRRTRTRRGARTNPRVDHVHVVATPLILVYSKR